MVLARCSVRGGLAGYLQKLLQPKPATLAVLPAFLNGPGCTSQNTKSKARMKLALASLGVELCVVLLPHCQTHFISISHISQSQLSLLQLYSVLKPRYGEYVFPKGLQYACTFKKPSPPPEVIEEHHTESMCSFKRGEIWQNSAVYDSFISPMVYSYSTNKEHYEEVSYEQAETVNTCMEDHILHQYLWFLYWSSAGFPLNSPIYLVILYSGKE